MPGQLYVISGPSGVGKSTIIKILRERVDGLGYSISHTSRRPRPGERNGVEYHFVNPETFEGMIEKGAFVEWARVYDHFYGTAFTSLEDQVNRDLDVLLDLDPQGGGRIREAFPGSILIFILPPSPQALEERLRGRATEDEGVIRARLEKARREIRECLHYDYLIFNLDLGRAVTEAASIITADRCRKVRQLPKLEKTFDLCPR
ncbi:MAG TPA: guanylate kinase [Desulfobacteraceae bacterium]|nr:guanylate kinase [Desulfobacteraceae bacterium]